MDVLVSKAMSSIASALFEPILKFVWGRAYTQHLWKDCFKVAAKSSDFDQDLAVHLASAPALERLMINTFKADRSVPSASDFAIAILFELLDRGENSNSQFSPDQIRHLAVGIRRHWLNGIINSSALQKRFVSIRDLHPAKLIGLDASCLNDENRLLGDYKEIVKRYFSSFSTSDSTETVRVWLPDEEGVVHYDECLRRFVEVKLNTSVGADRGFFRAGFDYSIERTGDRLHVCFLNTKTSMESGHFGRYSVGRATSHVLWAR
ncbi:hypothetical protein SAMN05216296_2637 [Pseudomonas pohangensis]|uniref:Uncharacterized protein n=1 Tax=Pseudomonas pohangensis TaxID=364197 RepID=A0A1H2GYU4_9PSED|nr:hypothetical protein [Pseudomonas pohangensis]SDU24754.1 hypothetical protein SAMN05216296_2637 [Pseudomonas pohangensis]